MARHKTTFAGALGAMAFLVMASLPTAAQAYWAPSCTYANSLPCISAGNDNETSVEQSLLSVFNYFIDVMPIDKADGTPTWGNKTINGDNGLLSVTGTQFDWGDSKKEAYAGTFDYSGPENIAFVTVKAGDNYVIYNYSELVKNGVNTWSTALLCWKGLSHLTIWKVVDNKVAEPAPLALMLMGLTFLAWRRSRKAHAAI